MAATTVHAPRRVLPGAGVLALAVSLLVGCSGERPPDGSAARRPSVILVSLDTLRRDRCGFHGYHRDTTPFLDELAARSLVFERAHATASWTLISHMTMLSGLYPTQHRVWEAEAALSPRVPTLAETLRAAGATTAGVHYPGWLDARFGFGRGFDAYREARSCPEAEEVLAELLPSLGEGPSFLFLHLFDIHADNVYAPGSRMYDTPAPYDTLFDPEAPALLEGIDAAKAYYEFAEGFTPRMRDAVGALYDGGIRYVDDHLRRWFADWEARGLLDDAIVIVTSDHGEGLALREYRFGGHGAMYEEGLRVPLIVHVTPGARRWLVEERGLDPAALEGRRDGLVSHVDLVPTLLDALDLPSAADLPGTSLLRPIPADRIVLAQRPPTLVAYRHREKATFGEDGAVVMYLDMDVDPEGLREGEPRDAASRARAEALAAEALGFMGRLWDPGDAAASGGLDRATKDSLRGLGYGREVGER